MRNISRQHECSIYGKERKNLGIEKIKTHQGEVLLNQGLLRHKGNRPEILSDGYDVG
jgi:hypothetical protein